MGAGAGGVACIPALLCADLCELNKIVTEKLYLNFLKTQWLLYIYHPA